MWRVTPQILGMAEGLASGAPSQETLANLGYPLNSWGSCLFWGPRAMSEVEVSSTPRNPPQRQCEQGPRWPERRGTSCPSSSLQAGAVGYERGLGDPKVTPRPQLPKRQPETNPEVPGGARPISSKYSWSVNTKPRTKTRCLPSRSKRGAHRVCLPLRCFVIKRTGLHFKNIRLGAKDNRTTKFTTNKASWDDLNYKCGFTKGFISEKQKYQTCSLVILKSNVTSRRH